MKKIAIKPHKTRGKEVISILEKNGGVNCNEYSGTEHIEHPVAYYVAVDHYIVFSNITFLEQRGYKIYTLEEWEDECKSDEMIEGLVEEEIIDIDDFQDDNEIIDVIDEYVHRLKNNECQINLPEGYQFTDENGNVINATKIVLEKKKKEYPKTYCECKDILGLRDIDDTERGYYKTDLIDKLQMLLICRDAYWKIAGDEMGLGKPWEPDWTYNGATKYCIGISENKIQNFSSGVAQYTLAFPTEKMRDAFYENFKELIEICKELL